MTTEPKRTAHKLNGQQFLTVGNALSASYSKDGSLTMTEKEIAAELAAKLGFGISSANISHVRRAVGLKPRRGSIGNGKSKASGSGETLLEILDELKKIRKALERAK